MNERHNFTPVETLDRAIKKMIAEYIEALAKEEDRIWMEELNEAAVGQPREYRNTGTRQCKE